MKRSPKPAASMMCLAAASIAPVVAPARTGSMAASWASRTRLWIERCRSLGSPTTAIRVVSARYPSKAAPKSMRTKSPTSSLRLVGRMWGSAELGPDWTRLSNDSVPPSSPIAAPSMTATASSVWPGRSRPITSPVTASVMAAARTSFSISSSVLIRRSRRSSGPMSIISIAPASVVSVSAAATLRCCFSTPRLAAPPSAPRTKRYGSWPSRQATTSVSSPRCAVLCSSSAGTMSVTRSGRIASAINRSIGSAWKPVMYAMDTGLVTYTASRLCRASHSRRPAIRDSTATLALLNGDDADGVCAVRGLDLHFVTHAMADHRLAKRGLVAHAAGLGIRLRRAHDAVGLLVLPVLAEPHSAAHADHASGLLGLDQDVVFHDRLELIDPRFHHALLVLGGVVLEVLRKVAQLAGSFDLRDDCRSAHRGELLELFAHGFQPLGCDVNVTGHLPESSLSRLESRHEKAPAHDCDAPHGDGAGRRRRS